MRAYAMVVPCRSRSLCEMAGRNRLSRERALRTGSRVFSRAEFPKGARARECVHQLSTPKIKIRRGLGVRPKNAGWVWAAARRNTSEFAKPRKP
jgi:hypothetical protein